MSIVSDILTVAVERVPAVYEAVRAMNRKVGEWQDKVTFRDRVWLRRDQIRLLRKEACSCGHVPDLIDRFCPQCGSRLSTPNWLDLARQDALFCPYCLAVENNCHPTCVRKRHPR